MSTNVVAVFDLHRDGLDAVQDLIDHGFLANSISVAANDARGRARLVTPDESGDLSEAGALAGAGSGAIVGGIVGLVAGAGFGFVPWLGLVVAGPLAGLLTGATTGALAGGLVGGIIGLGIPEYDAHVYAEAVRRGSTLVSVQVGDENRVGFAEDILKKHNAINIEERGLFYRSTGFTGYDSSAPPFSDAEVAAERERYMEKTGEPIARRYPASGGYAYADRDEADRDPLE